MFSAGEPSQAPKPWAVVLDSGRGVGRLIPRCRPFAMAPAGEPSQAPSRGRFAIGSSWWAVSRSKAVGVYLSIFYYFYKIIYIP